MILNFYMLLAHLFVLHDPSFLQHDTMNLDERAFTLDGRPQRSPALPTGLGGVRKSVMAGGIAVS